MMYHVNWGWNCFTATCEECGARGGMNIKYEDAAIERWNNARPSENIRFCTSAGENGYAQSPMEMLTRIVDQRDDYKGSAETSNLKLANARDLITRWRTRAVGAVNTFNEVLKDCATELEAILDKTEQDINAEIITALSPPTS